MNEYVKANRDLWNAWTPHHVRSAFYDVEGFKAGRVRLRHGVDHLHTRLVGDVRGKRFLHLQCHFGLDTIAWAQRGAVVTGIDFSSEAINAARALADEMKIPATFVCSDVYELPSNLEGTFDIVYTSGGVLFWLRDLDRWAAIVAHFLAPGGVFYILEMHPVINVFDRQDASGLRVAYPYFHTPEPLAFPVRGTFADQDAGQETVEYCWNYGLGEVITALIGAGLRIEYVHEFPYATARWFPFMRQGADGWWRWEDPTSTLPLMFSLRATK